MSSRRDDRTTIGPPPLPPPRRAPSRTVVETPLANVSQTDEVSVPGRGAPRRPPSRPSGLLPAPRPSTGQRPASSDGRLPIPPPRAGSRGGQPEPRAARPETPAPARPQRPVEPPRPRKRSACFKDPASARPFRFERLESVDGAEMRLVPRVDWLMPGDPSQARAALSSRLGALLEHPVQFQLAHVHVSRPDQLSSQIPEPAFLAQLSVAPHLARGFAEVELGLAHAVIDQLLGGAPGEASLARALTEIEEGVLGYLLVEGLKALASGAPPERPRLRLESPLRSVEDAVARLTTDEPLVVMQFVMTVGDLASGYLRFFLPASSVAASTPAPDGALRKARFQALLARHAARLYGARTSVWAEVGHCEVSASDLAALGPGDVVLLERLSARFDRGEEGDVELHVGKGDAGHWEARIRAEDGSLVAELVALHLGPRTAPRSIAEAAEAEDGEALEARAAEEAEEGASDEGFEGGDSDSAEGESDESFEDDSAPAEDEGSGEEDGDSAGDESDSGFDAPHEEDDVSADAEQSAGNAELLADVPLHVTVEVGRTAMSAEEVVALRPGQVIALGRAPGTQVDLSVNGKLVAQGELVEVEGQFGVRVTALHGG